LLTQARQGVRQVPHLGEVVIKSCRARVARHPHRIQETTCRVCKT
jgi:hypothetical protein